MTIPFDSFETEFSITYTGAYAKGISISQNIDIIPDTSTFTITFPNGQVIEFTIDNKTSSKLEGTYSSSGTHDKGKNKPFQEVPNMNCCIL